MPYSLYIEELPCFLTSEEVFARLAGYPGTVFLDSSDANGFAKRYSILATNPLEQVSSLEELRQQEIAHHVKSPLPFVGGWIGYLAYEAYASLIPQVSQRQTLYPQVSFGFYDTFICFDHVMGKAWIASLGLTSPEGHSDETLARQQMANLHQRMEMGSSFSPDESRVTLRTCSGQASHESQFLQPSVSKQTYCEHIAAIHEYIRAGDCYQVNYTQCFEGMTSVPPDILYRRLRRISPAPFAAYLNMDFFQILSASPESFLEIKGDCIKTHPIKGTRPRASTPEDDRRLRQELLESTKDRAELLMITDLERNDLGKVCQAGTVKTARLVDVLELAQVYHLYSVVEGRLRDGVKTADILEACFPGGSITGAPKIRAMQIIRELESHSREIYTGAIGYIGVDGRSHFNIPIRTMIYEEGQVKIYAGGGIVADSDPELEYEECWIKAKGMREALGSA